MNDDSTGSKNKDYKLARDQLLKLAAQDAAKIVTLVGETGSGKEVFAKEFHINSGRRDKRYQAFNCARLQPDRVVPDLFGYTKGSFTGANKDRVGLLEELDGGVVFLDELDKTTVEVQSKLLRFFETGEIQPLGSNTVTEVDLRTLVGLGINPVDWMKSGGALKDFVNRLMTHVIIIPPLRDRPEDITGLANTFVEELSKEFDISVSGISPDILQILVHHDYKNGNVRELKSIIESAIAQLQPQDGQQQIKALAPFWEWLIRESKTQLSQFVGGHRDVDGDLSLKQLKDDYESRVKARIVQCYDKHGNLKSVADDLKAPYSTIQAWVRKLGIKTNTRHTK